MRFVSDEKAGDILVFCLIVLMWLCEVCLFIGVSGVRW